MKQKLRDGTVDCAYGFIDGRRGIAIVNADSNEEAMKLVMEYPAWPILEIEIHPLCDVEQFLDANIEVVNRTVS